MGQALYSGVYNFRCQARVAPRSPPCSFFYKCILQGAVDLRSCRSGVVERNGMQHVLRRGRLCT